MAASNFVIYDSTTGAVARTIVGDITLATANTGAGEAALDVGSARASSEKAYVANPATAPTLTARPANTAVIPETVTAGDDLALASVPDGASVTVSLFSGDGSSVHSGTKSGGAGAYDASIGGTTAGDVLLVEVGTFPHRIVRGFVAVT